LTSETFYDRLKLFIEQGGIAVFEQENQYYEENRDELRTKYIAKHLVISKDRLIGVYESVEQAYDDAMKTMTSGSFVIKYLPENPDDEIVRVISLAYA
jgi:hypothetical protein